jgi:3-oxoacyl-[acyl-carrier protein] reductase
VDVLVNSAGVNVLGMSGDVQSEGFKNILQVNLVAPLNLVVGVAQSMKKKRYGRILNLSSRWSLVTREHRVSYSASKAALNGLTRSLAIELAPCGVLVNALAPGYVNTEMTYKNNSPQEISDFTFRIPLGRMGTAEELAEVAAFLCSKRNSYMTGQVIVVDGGYTCQ